MAVIHQCPECLRQHDGAGHLIGFSVAVMISALYFIVLAIWDDLLHPNVSDEGGEL